MTFSVFLVFKNFCSSCNAPEEMPAVHRSPRFAGRPALCYLSIWIMAACCSPKLLVVWFYWMRCQQQKCYARAYLIVIWTVLSPAAATEWPRLPMKWWMVFEMLCSRCFMIYSWVLFIVLLPLRPFANNSSLANKISGMRKCEEFVRVCGASGGADCVGMPKRCWLWAG